MAHPIDIAFGKRLKQLRKEGCLSQTDLAKVCNISFQQVQKYESGVNRVSISRLYELAEGLQVDVNHLIRGLDK